MTEVVNVSPVNKVQKIIKLSLGVHNLNRSAETKLGLSLTQYYLLLKLRDLPGCSPQTLAEELGVHPSSLTQSLKRAVKKEAIFILVDPKDSRRKILGLTRSGLKLMQEFEQGIAELIDLDEHSLITSYLSR